MSSAPDIDLVLPCYNPVQGWERNVIQSMGELRRRFPRQHIRALVVNDGSVYEPSRAAFEWLENQGQDITVISYPHNMGKGFAVRTGVQRAIAPVIVFTDIDFPYTMESMVRVITPVLEKKADITLAVRNDTYYSQLPLVRKWMSRILRNVNRTVLGLHTSDTQGGLKAFRQEVRDTFLKTKINRYLFDLEFIYLISREKQWRIQTVESDLRPGIVMSPVRMKILLGESLNFLKVLVRK